MNEDLKYQRAKERVQEIKGVYIHIVIFFSANIGLMLVNLLTNREHLWFYWPALGWGVGLLAHSFTVFVSGGWFGKEWEEKKMQSILKKMEDNESKEE